MPTIKVRKQANGITRYTAIIRMRRAGAIIHRDSKTFAHRTAALSWAAKPEVRAGVAGFGAADAVRFLIRSSYITAHVLAVDGGTILAR